MTRSRPVADVFGAPVLRGQGTARPMLALEHRELGKHCRAACQWPLAQLTGPNG